MRKCLVFVIAVATFGIVAEHASAETKLIGKHSFTKVYDACVAAGGTFTQYPSNSYGCEKKNCDGKGGECSVYCDADQNCNGTTPDRATPPPGKFDLVKILRFSPGGPPRTGLLEPTPGGSPHGPSGPGAPKPATPPAGKLY